jgi:ketosteroid isomerase-like protein
VSAEAADVVRRWFDGMARGELDLQLCHPEMRIENAKGWVIETTYTGREGARRWWDDLAEAFSDFRLELGELTPIDDERVLTTQRFHGHFRKTGIELDAPWASVITVRDGLMVEAVGYFTKGQAMRAAGVGVAE